MLVQVGPRLLLADEDDDDDDDDDYVPRLMGTDNYESEAWCCASLDRSEYDYAIGPSELEAVAGPHAQALVTQTRLRPRPPAVPAPDRGAGDAKNAGFLKDDILRPMMPALRGTVLPIARELELEAVAGPLVQALCRVCALRGGGLRVCDCTTV